MRHQDQITQARKLLSYLDTRTTAMADSIYRNPVRLHLPPSGRARARGVLSSRPGQYRSRLPLTELGRLDDPRLYRGADPVGPAT